MNTAEPGKVLFLRERTSQIFDIGFGDTLDDSIGNARTYSSLSVSIDRLVFIEIYSDGIET